MEQLGALFLRVCTVSAGCSVVLALLLALLPKLREKIAARSLYVLFLVLALRLLLPVEVRLPAPAVTVPTPDYTVSVPVPRPAPAQPNVGQVQPVQDPVVSPEPARKIPVLHVLGLIWVLGGLGCALLSVGGFLLARRRLLKGSVPADVDLESLRRELRVRRPVGLVYSAAAPCPLALGLLRPVIVLPAGQLVDELVLRHELTHIRRWDVAYKLVLSLACWLNWFNPLVWLMDKAAGRNLELCCDDEVTRDLSGDERRRYGNLLLDAAVARVIPFSTCFSGGKTQMKERLVNLFAHKRNSAALVGLVLIAALLAGGLVACEQAGASAPTGSPDVTPSAQLPTLSPENEARRALLKDYFYANYTEDNASVVLADLTGDGLEEMLLLTVSTRDGATAELSNVTAENFSYGEWKVFGVKDGAVIEYPALSAVSSSHAGWGYQYLIPLADAEGWAVLDFRPYTGQGQAAYSYSVIVLDEAAGTWQSLDGGEVYFHIVPEDADSATLIMGEDVWADSSAGETEQLLSRVQAYRNSGAPLLVYNEAYGDTTGGPEFEFLRMVPSGAFDGTGGVYKTEDNIAPSGAASDMTVEFPLPNPPDSPEEALNLLEASVQAADGVFVFRVPNYDGEWYIHVAGRMRMDAASHPADTPEMYMSVHYLEGKEWTPGKRYSFETVEGAYYNDLYMFVTVTAPDGTQAERTIVLAGPQNEVDSDLPDSGEN